MKFEGKSLRVSIDGKPLEGIKSVTIVGNPPPPPSSMLAAYREPGERFYPMPYVHRPPEPTHEEQIREAADKIVAVWRTSCGRAGNSEAFQTLLRFVDLSRFSIPVRLFGHWDWDVEAYAVDARIDVKHVNTGEPVAVNMRGYFDLPMSNEGFDVLRYFRKCIRELVGRLIEHEIDECFEFAGTRPFDPHVNERPLNFTGAAASSEAKGEQADEQSLRKR